MVVVVTGGSGRGGGGGKNWGLTSRIWLLGKMLLGSL